MSLIKSKTTPYGFDAEYWIIKRFPIEFFPEPSEIIRDGDDNITDVVGGAQSLVVLSLYKDQAAYLDGSAPIMDESYPLPCSFVYGSFYAQNSPLSVSQKTYSYIKNNFEFFSDAVDAD